MSKECVWIRPEDDIVINKWFVDYWLEYRTIIEKKYPDTHKVIDRMVKDKLIIKGLKEK